MERWLISFFLGLLLSLFLPKVPELFYILCIVLSCCTLLFFARNSCYTAFFCGVCVILVNAFIYFSWHSINSIDRATVNAQPLLIKGEVLSLVTEQAGTVRFNLKLTDLDTHPLKSKVVIRLSWQQPSLALSQGDTVQLLVKLKPAHGLANLGGFSYQKWLLQHRIVMTGYVLRSANSQVIVEQPTLRQSLYYRLVDMHEFEHKGLMLALALGDKSAITTEQWQILQKTGTAHLMAISGLHLGLIAGFGLLFMRGLVYLIPNRLLPERHLYLLPIGFSVLVACGYAYLAGFSLPTVRALIMLLVFWGLRLCGGKVSLIRWLLLTLFVILIIEPFSILDSSLYLSLSAVCTILFVIWRFQYALSGKGRFTKFIYSLLIIQAALTLLLMPVTALLFKQVSALNFVANIVVVPMLSVTAIPLVLLATLACLVSTTLSHFLLYLANKSLTLAWYYLELLMQYESFVVAPQRLLMMAILLTAVTLLALAINVIKVKQAVAVVCLLLVAQLGSYHWLDGNQRRQNKWQMTVFDVGHGLAIMIEKNNQAILYDTGASYPSGFSMVESVITPYLSSQYIEYFDQVIISHKDNDHSGGLNYLQKNQLSKQYRYNFQPKFASDKVPKSAVLMCQQGNEFSWQGLQFKVLWPIDAVGDKNDDSCVLEIFDGVNRVLLPGDISSLVEFSLVNQQQTTPVDVLIAAHHGSKTSSSQAFINAVKAEYVVFSSGYLNRWDMPVEQVTERFEKAQTIAFNTSEIGMVQFDFNKEIITPRTYKSDLMPFWPWLEN